MNGHSRISGRLASMRGSKNAALHELAKVISQNGPLFDLTQGQLERLPPTSFTDAAAAALTQRSNGYTDTVGLPALREQIAEYASRKFGLHIEPSQTVITAGAKPALYETMLAIVEAGDEVIIPSPYWTSFPEQVRLVGAAPIFVDFASSNYVLTSEAIERAITPQTRLILINSPNNPTGSRISDEELDKIVTLARSRSIYIVFDECYRDLTFFRDTERPLGAILRNLQGVVVIDAFSKPWALTGWRIGYLAASPDVVRAVSTIQTHIISNPNSLAQHALLQVLKDGGADDFVQKAREDLLRRRDWLMAHLTDIKGVKTPEPKGGLFAYVDVRDLMNQENCPDVETLCAELLQKERTLVVPGTAFGHSGGFRISFGGDEIQLHEGVKRVSQFLRAFRHG